MPLRPPLTPVAPGCAASAPADFGPIRFADKPDIDFRMLGYTDLAAEDFVYFKTQVGQRMWTQLRSKHLWEHDRPRIADNQYDGRWCVVKSVP